MTKTAKKKASAKVEKTEAPEAPAVEAPEAAPADDGTQLTIADLQAIAGVIDGAVRRGAFGAGEVGEVSAIYAKLANFLKIVAEQQKAAEAQQGGQ
mgnify:CR=1 FL=1